MWLVFKRKRLKSAKIGKKQLFSSLFFKKPVAFNDNFCYNEYIRLIRKA